MSPEVALLVRAALLGLVVLAAEHLGKRRHAGRQAKRAAAEHTIIRLPAPRSDRPLAGRPLQLSVRPHTAASTASAPNSGQANLGQAKIVRLGSIQATDFTAEAKLYDGHVTEKRAA